MRKTYHAPDFILVFIVLALTFFGVIMIYDASVVKAYVEFGNKLYFLKSQGIGVGIGLVLAAVVYFIDYRFYKKIALPLILLGLFLLILVYLPVLGIRAYGSQRWLNLGFTSIQPSEIIKLFYVIYLATLFSNRKEQIKSFWNSFVPFLIITAIVFFLIFFQPDFGTSFQIVANGIVMFFLAGASLVQMGVVFPLSGALGFLLIWMEPYRRDRLLSFLNPNSDTLGTSYHINQILIALGSGGLFGLGWGSSRQKYQYLPEVMTDSIFAIVGEELGFIGVILILMAFFGLIWRGMKIAKDAPDKFSQLLAIGITGWIGIQALTNLGAMSSLIPLTGVPLPFISYGRSSIVTILIGIGILLNISRQTLREEKRNSVYKGEKS